LGVGFFGGFLYERGEWTEWNITEAPPTGEEPWLSLYIHDSDFATLAYAPSGAGTGIAHLGVTPRVYFEDDGASTPTDADAEAAGLAGWLVQSGLITEGGATFVGLIRSFLASDDDDEPDYTDMADVFVEGKTVRFLRTAGLPVPAGLAGNG
jgi:hypothetical protein